MIVASIFGVSCDKQHDDPGKGTCGAFLYSACFLVVSRTPSFSNPPDIQIFNRIVGGDFKWLPPGSCADHVTASFSTRLYDSYKKLIIYISEV